MVSDMRASENCFKIIERFEGLRLKPYQDSGGVWTVFWGHTEGVTADFPVPQDREKAIALAKKYLRNDIQTAEKVVNAYVKIKLNQNQFDSLVSFVFNVGAGRFRKSTLLRLINCFAQDYEIRREFMRYIYDKQAKNPDKPQPGLVKRRTIEAELFLQSLSVEEIQNQLVKIPMVIKGSFRKLKTKES